MTITIPPPALAPKDGYDLMQWTMIHAHEVIKRGYENILLYLEPARLPKSDTYNFLGYCLAWAQLLKEHHDGEGQQRFLFHTCLTGLLRFRAICLTRGTHHSTEAVVFPFLNKKLDFHNEIDQHKVIFSAVEKIIATINLYQADTSAYDPEYLKSLMVPLREPLYEHLDEEVVHLAPENLKVFTEDEIQGMFHDMVQWSKRNGSPFLTLPFMRCHVAPEFKAFWPQFPWFLRVVIIPWVLAWRHSGISFSTLMYYTAIISSNFTSTSDPPLRAFPEEDEVHETAYSTSLNKGIIIGEWEDLPLRPALLFTHITQFGSHLN
ncbi:hypothetical protein QCA50_011050 [Cerrena zonata]|uniref:Uncharacterized protein n=1 Tax=Cerrena zonata TaxID=2478898 RepID=A0AAW0FY11_9APHY